MNESFILTIICKHLNKGPLGQTYNCYVEKQFIIIIYLTLSFKNEFGTFSSTLFVKIETLFNVQDYNSEIWRHLKAPPTNPRT